MMDNLEVVETNATEKYALDFYNLLLAKSTVDTIPGEDGPITVNVFRGKLLEAFQSLGISNIYYTRIRRIFLKYGCVEYLQRGTKSYDSVLVLNQAPPGTLEEEDLTDGPGDATLSAVANRVSNLEHRVRGLDSWRESTGGINIVDAFRQVERRLSKLESQLTGDNDNAKGS